MIRFALLLFALFGFSGLLSARTVRSGSSQVYRSYRPARVTIAVEDKETKDPLIGATVSIINRTDTLRGTTAKEDFYRTLAVYKCDRIFRDSVDLEVTYIGYKPYKKRFAATEFRSRIEVKMEVDEQSIAQVVVVGKQIAMVFKGDTTVYNAGAFKTLADDRFEELLKQLPGVEIKDNKILAGGEEVKRVLIDGKNFFGNKSQYALTDLEASDVKSVRVYEELSPEAKRQGNTTARKEKVMDVETKSKRSVLQGGNLEASIGASLEKDYSGRREIRHSEAGTYYRNSEKGNWRIEASNQKDDNSQAENASFNSKLTPTKQTDARAEYTYRRGDSTLVSTTVDFQRRRQSSVSRSMTEYFPTDDYALRTEESSGESLSKNLSGSLSNLTSIQRKKNTFFAMTDIRFDSGDSYSRSATSRRIDNDETRTHLNNDSDNRNLSFNIRLNYYISLSKRSSLSFWIIGDYGTQDQNGWQIDTTASVQGLQVKLRNNGDGRRYGFETSVDYGYKVGENVRFSTSYSFKRGYDRSKMLAIDFLGDPQGELDLVNSYSYTNDSYSHNLRANLNYGRDGLWIMGALTGSVHRIARDERFPERQRFPRTFYQLSPWFNLTAGSSSRRFNLNIISQSQMISTESLRSTLDATNPLSLRAGNPDLKLPNDITGSVGITFNNAPKARNVWFNFNGGYTFNYIASQRILFLEETYLPQYDYTAQKGAQLSTQTNVEGCYKLGGMFGFSQQISSLRSTVNAGIDYNFQQTPYFLEETLYHSGRHALSFRAGFESGFSSKVKISVSSVTSMSSYSAQNSNTQDLREMVRARLDLRFGKYFASVANAYEFYCNSNSKAQTRHNVILNAAAGRKFGKENRLGISLGVVDILNRPDYASTVFETDYMRTSSVSYLGRYGYLRMAYTF
ncbi:hypothetical protein [Alistipes sp.]|uniref:hypothetical protein n=1 Tax=Alistipes sp. TaxID=1872444 RepID=UPI003AB2C3E0